MAIAIIVGRDVNDITRVRQIGWPYFVTSRKIPSAAWCCAVNYQDCS